jgi:hypothetical protein
VESHPGAPLAVQLNFPVPWGIEEALPLVGTVSLMRDGGESPIDTDQWLPSLLLVSETYGGPVTFALPMR